MDNRKQMGIPVMGGSSLLVIFAVLCLVVFALLCLTTAQAYGRLADASVRAVEEYYAADCRAQEILAQLRGGTIPDGVWQDGRRYGYTCPVSETQALYAEVQQVGAEWQILRWQTASTAGNIPEETLPVWKGE